MPQNLSIYCCQLLTEIVSRSGTNFSRRRETHFEVCGRIFGQWPTIRKSPIALFTTPSSVYLLIIGLNADPDPAFVSVRIRIQIQEAKSMRIWIRILARLCGQKELNFYMKNLLNLGSRYETIYGYKNAKSMPFRILIHINAKTVGESLE
jgi:hypothetical protein